jgi:hypothetical protein
MDNTTALWELMGKCCSCGGSLPQGGWWGWHREGYRVGPFCNSCATKPDVERQVDSPV